MSTLTGQQIQSSYQGLLKLSNSSTGITSTLQSIEDGLGGNTGLRLSTNQLEAPNILTSIAYKAQYYGSGFLATAAAQMASGTQNVILAYPFYDQGLYSYSALTYNLVTATSTSDTCEAAIYTSQMVNPYGIQPYSPIISGLSITTTGSTGQKTLSFGSNISMSGYGGGLYWMVFKVSNAGVQPTVRFGGGSIGTISTVASANYGQTLSIAGTAYTTGQRPNGNYYVYSGTTTFNNPYTSGIATTQSTTATFAGSNLGFILHTTDY